MKQLPPFYAKLEKNDPEFYSCVEELQRIVMKPGALDLKTKMLILLAVDAFAGSTGVKGISKVAQASGCNEAEIKEALRIVASVSVNKVLNISMNAFDD